MMLDPEPIGLLFATVARRNPIAADTTANDRFSQEQSIDR